MSFKVAGFIPKIVLSLHTQFHFKIVRISWRNGDGVERYFPINLDEIHGNRIPTNSLFRKQTKPSSSLAPCTVHEQLVTATPSWNLLDPLKIILKDRTKNALWTTKQPKLFKGCLSLEWSKEPGLSREKFKN